MLLRPGWSRGCRPARRSARSAPACSTSTGPSGTIANAVARRSARRSARSAPGLLVQFLPGADAPGVPRAVRRVRRCRRVGVALMAETSHPRPGALPRCGFSFALPPGGAAAAAGGRAGAGRRLVAGRASTARSAPTLVRLHDRAQLVRARRPGAVRAGRRAARSTVLAAAQRRHRARRCCSGAAGADRRRRPSPAGRDRRAARRRCSSSAPRSPASASAPASRAPSAASSRWPRRTSGPACCRSCTSISYLAMGLPAVIAGVLVVHGGGVVTTAREYGAGGDRAGRAGAARARSRRRPAAPATVPGRAAGAQRGRARAGRARRRHASDRTVQSGRIGTVVLDVPAEQHAARDRRRAVPVADPVERPVEAGEVVRAERQLELDGRRRRRGWPARRRSG